MPLLHCIVAADCPYGDSNDAELIDNWMNHTYGNKVRFGITCGFDGGEFTGSCDRAAYDAAREVGLHFFPPADMAHATAL